MLFSARELLLNRQNPSQCLHLETFSYRLLKPRPSGAGSECQLCLPPPSRLVSSERAHAVTHTRRFSTGPQHDYILIHPGSERSLKGHWEGQHDVPGCWEPAENITVILPWGTLGLPLPSGAVASGVGP